VNSIPLNWLWNVLTMLGAVATAVIIYWQAGLLRAQNQVYAIMQLNLAWDSREMCSLRSAWADNAGDAEAAEPILEFLEEFSALLKRDVFNEELVWDSTLGWYAVRYYFYSQENETVERLRAKWRDPKLYEHIEGLWQNYRKREDAEWCGGEETFEQKLQKTRDSFVADEKARYARRFPESRH